MEDGEKEQGKAGAKDRSPSPAIKSTAVVKYTSVQSPVEYARLQCNTDLNLPPLNWGAAIDSYGLKQILTRGTGLSSFRMAHMFPDSVGEVDVISGAECIKKLLKLPHQPKGTVSMVVHRIHNTLLLDELDVYRYLVKSEWGWLRDFFYENIMKTMTEQERTTLMISDQAHSAMQLTRKFLQHSVTCAPAAPPAPPAPPPLQGPYLPEPEAPQAESETPIDQTDHLYNRNVLWTFEDIQMLIGSDLPIFGGNDRPCVSLRLRDAREPINVLTGIDYWLDNLMCNVPEVLMCYHLDGIVQKYEPMKTEDLPNMENSKFSPKVIRNVAQNILSFLKANATKAGHTYWLFKGPHDDVVKLYDLTSLCPDALDNPFTTPVAMLLYRVARNMRLTNRSKHVKQLLEQAISLLRADAHAQIVASAHYMLADLLLPAATDPARPEFTEESQSESDAEEPCYESEEDESNARDLALSHIADRAHHTHTGPKSREKESEPLGTSPPDRCGKALQHALKGLIALQSVPIDKCKEEERERLRQQIIIEEQSPKMANPYEPIKMNYEPLRRKLDSSEPKEHQSRSRRRRRERKNTDKTNYQIDTQSNVDKNAIQVRKENNVYPSWHEPNRDDNFAWKLHLKTLLYEKICLAFATLAEHSYSHEAFGFSLKYIDLASKCQNLLSNMIIKSRIVDASCLLGRVGDNFFQLSKNWARLDQFKLQFEKDHEVDSKLRAEIENDVLEETEGVLEDEFNLDLSLPSDELDSMVRSCEYYERALNVTAEGKKCELLRRLASVKNELGVRYMNEAQTIYTKALEETDEEDAEKPKQTLKQFTQYCTKSWDTLQEASDIFERVGDMPNLALLYCNKARFLRFRANCEMEGFSSDKRSYYSKAEDLYQAALKVLGSQESGGGASVRELVRWELSSHLYTKAAHMQDQPPRHEVNEVADALKLSLKYCRLTPGPRQYLYQFRAAMTLHRLASLYHAQYRCTTEEGPRRRTLLNATRSNYEQASNLLAALEEAAMFLTVQLEHVALLETNAAVSPNLKLKSLQTALQLLRQCHSIMKVIKQRDPDEKPTPNPEQETPKPEEETGCRSEIALLTLYENRLHCILKSIIQYCRSKSNKDYEKLTDMYKRLYCASLKIKKDDDVRKFADSICDVLTAMDEISKQCEQ
ncbi:erythroid differentiation-related factor 1 [Plutella xylostella]|uniref:erythroid differentiation-related factor 1 n=1 Tax=Plutella xylostella TaxID=51655 RepID=UPI0020329E8C|nr:erythroid differentiation-related factor 1 [Plutella xylostella]